MTSFSGFAGARFRTISVALRFSLNEFRPSDPRSLWLIGSFPARIRICMITVAVRC
jgi:hypothetical protein